MGPMLCRNHGFRFFTSASETVQAAIGQGVALPAQTLRIVRVVKPDAAADLVVDAAFIHDLGLTCDDDGVVTLHERDVAAHELHDRLLLQRIYKRLAPVCPDCLGDMLMGRLDDAKAKYEFDREGVPGGPANGALPLRCPCCGYKTLGGRGSYEICEVCSWEDDGQDHSDASRVLGGPNPGLSLTQARIHYRRFGASRREDLARVRPPRASEF